MKFTERLWSYLRIKELLNQANLAENETMKENLKLQALNMSLSYVFKYQKVYLKLNNKIYIE